jgi:hypothetical protein
MTTAPDTSHERDTAPTDSARPSIGTHYRRHIRKTGREARFLIALAFLVTFGIVRFVTWAIRYHWLPFLHNTVMKSGLHIHHMVYGIFLLLIVGYFALAFPEKQGTRLIALALLYGIGAALTLDEFALWLNLQDVYWAKQGRESVDIAIGAAGLFALLGIGAPFWSALWRDLWHRRPTPARSGR